MHMVWTINRYATYVKILPQFDATLQQLSDNEL
jgi:hypothetical protein